MRPQHKATLIYDSPPTLLPCPVCPSGHPIAPYPPCDNGRSSPCAERVAAVHAFDITVALDLVPPQFPTDAWAMVVQAIVESRRGPTGLPVGGGVLHVLGAEGGMRVATLYFQERSRGVVLSARATMAELKLGRGCGHILDAIDVYFARVNAPPDRREDEEKARRFTGLGKQAAKGTARDRAVLRHLSAEPPGLEAFFPTEILSHVLGRGEGLSETG